MRDTSAIGNRTLGVVLSTLLQAGHRFGVHCPDTDAVYLVPIKEVGPHTSAYLRVEPAKNNQAKGVRWAMDYEVRTKLEWCRC